MSIAGTEPAGTGPTGPGSPRPRSGAAHRQPGPPPRRPDPHTGRYAAGQLLGLGVVLLISLPLLPVLLLLVAWLRLRRRGGAAPR